MKRSRIITAKLGQLKAAWGRLAKEPYNRPSICYVYGGGGAASCDAYLLCQAIEGKTFIPQPNGTYTTGPSLLEQLDANGYDITTLKISVQMKTPLVEDQNIPST